jgi:hypothetical protein
MPELYLRKRLPNATIRTPSTTNDDKNVMRLAEVGTPLNCLPGPGNIFSICCGSIQAKYTAGNESKLSRRNMFVALK